MSLPTPDWPAVVERLERLERQNRRMKQAGAVALILVAAVLFMGQAPSQRTVEANEFVLKDANGRVRGKWSMNGDIALFTILDSKETPRIVLAHDGPLDRTVFHLRATNGNHRVSLEINSKQEPSLFFQGAGDSFMAYLGPDESGPSTLRLFGTDGKVLWKAP